jgi:hypothetical protein
MIVCLVWFSLMTREGEIGMKSSAPGDSRGPGTVFTPCAHALDRMMLTIAHTDIVRRADLNLGIEETVRQPANLAGVHIGDPSLDGSIVHIYLPENLEPE